MKGEGGKVEKAVARDHLRQNCYDAAAKVLITRLEEAIIRCYIAKF